jgi:biopolymer transport protein ExbD
MATRLGGVSKVLLMVFVFALGAGSTLFVIRLPDILPDHGETAPAYLDGRVEVETQPEPMISLVRNDAVASTADSANWDVVVYPPIATSEEAAASSADAVAKTPDLFVPTENSLPPTVPDVAPLDAFANEPVPQDPGLAPGEFSAPPTLAGSPLELPTTEPEPVPQRDPDAAPSLFDPAAAEPQVAGDDPFSSPSGLSLPEATSTSTPSPPTPSSAPAIEIVLLQLAANEDGSLKQLRYFTEELGNDDNAFQQLADRIAAWGKAWEENGPPHETELHIEADESLRFESVTRVVALCTPHVTRILLAKAVEGPIVTVTVGFVRDTKGKQVSGTPVLIFEDQTVDWDSLEARFDEWAKKQRTRDPAWQRRYTVVIRADEGVEAKVVESIIKKANEYGFENFTLKTIDVAQSVAPAVSGIVNQIDPETRLVQISIGDDDGLRPGRRLSVFRAYVANFLRQVEAIGRLEVVRVQSDSAACRIIEEDAEMRIGVGDNVETIGSAEDAPALEPDQSRF